MGIFGAIVGGLVGGIFGPIGVILGAAVGSNVTSGRLNTDPYSGGGRRVSARSARDMQMVFAVALTTLAAKVAKADGKVTQDEIRAFDSFLQQSLHLSVEDRKIAARVFNEARHTVTPVSEFTHQIRGLFRTQPERLHDIVSILLAVALADGHLHEAEEILIQRISRDFGMSDADYQSCKATFNAQHGGPATAASAYEVLGVSPTVSDAEVKSAHRKLVREYHPDTLQSKGLPEEFMEYANDKMAAINDAWARIKKERGI